jgi:Chromo (CHRromatin Organisation MOdifier) domain
MPPFELALSRPPITLSLQATPRRDEIKPDTEKQTFLERLKTLRTRATENLHKAQARYKRNYDQGVTPKNANLREGDLAYLRVEITETGRNHKLESLVQGPYEVLENAGETFRLRIGGETVRVSSDRVTPAPIQVEDPQQSPDSASPPQNTTRVSYPSSNRRRVRFSDEINPLAEFVVERIVDAAMDERGSILYRIRWLGYKDFEDTWQGEDSIPNQFIRRYWKTKGLTTLQGQQTLH